MFQNFSLCSSIHITFSLEFAPCHKWLAWGDGEMNRERWCCNSCADCLQAGGTLPPALLSSLSLSPLCFSWLAAAETLQPSLSLLLYLLPPPALGGTDTTNHGRAPTVLANHSPGEFCVVRCYVCTWLPWRRRGKQVINHENTQIRACFALEY